MSATTRWAADQGFERLAGSAQTIASVTTTAFDFGTPNDINLVSLGLNHGDRVVVHLSALRAGGTSGTLTFSVLDAPDNAGSIGSTATATTHGTIPALAADSGAVHASGVVSVFVKQGRPWLRISAVEGGSGTDSFQCHATVYGVRQ